MTAAEHITETCYFASSLPADFFFLLSFLLALSNLAVNVMRREEGNNVGFLLHHSIQLVLGGENRRDIIEH